VDLDEQIRSKKKWGFRTMPISVPGYADHGSGMMAIMIPG